MAAPTTIWYSLAMKHMAQGDIAWVADTIKVMLVTSSYIPSQNTHEFRSDVTDEIAATGGYTAGGVALSAKAKTLDSATKEERLTAGTTLFASLTQSLPFRYAPIYKARGGLASADELLGLVDFGADQTPNGTDFVISWPVTGVLYMQAQAAT